MSSVEDIPSHEKHGARRSEHDNCLADVALRLEKRGMGGEVHVSTQMSFTIIESVGTCECGVVLDEIAKSFLGTVLGKFDRPFLQKNAENRPARVDCVMESMLQCVKHPCLPDDTASGDQLLYDHLQ